MLLLERPRTGPFQRDAGRFDDLITPRQFRRRIARSGRVGIAVRIHGGQFISR